MESAWVELNGVQKPLNVSVEKLFRGLGRESSAHLYIYVVYFLQSHSYLTLIIPPFTETKTIGKQQEIHTICTSHTVFKLIKRNHP